MLQKEKEISFKSLQWASGLLIVFVLLAATAFPAFSAKEKKVKNETIGASAMGTGSQMGQIIAAGENPGLIYNE